MASAFWSEVDRHLIRYGGSFSVTAGLRSAAISGDTQRVKVAISIPDQTSSGRAVYWSVSTAFTTRQDRATMSGLVSR